MIPRCSVRVLLVHNSYQFAGGEDRAVGADLALLASRGHESKLYLRTYEEAAKRKGLSQLGLAADVLWSRSAYRDLRRLIRDWRPDVAHFHNIFPLVSPSAYDACHAEGVPVVQTLHNFRLFCAAGTLLRDGKVCELCVGKVPWPAARYKCYRGSRSQSIVMAAVLGGHTARGTWKNKVDAYIALTEFGRAVFVRGGLPEDRLYVRPNALDAPEPAKYAGPRSAIFVGRLSPEKGVATLLDAWTLLPEVPLTVVGGGPLLAQLRERVAGRLPQVELTGELPHSRVLEMIRAAGMLVFPSLCYENLGYVVLEALSSGVPVIASNIGAQAEIVSEGVNGLLFTPGDARSLASVVTRLITSDDLARHLSTGARRIFLQRYSVETSYARLMDVYRGVGAA
jgi:glycosyltransferase involved in cell wall biosynthesis